MCLELSKGEGRAERRRESKGTVAASRFLAVGVSVTIYVCMAWGGRGGAEEGVLVRSRS